MIAQSIAGDFKSTMTFPDLDNDPDGLIRSNRRFWTIGLPRSPIMTD
ncbi:hypothetical protein ACSVBT_08395 [Afipia sp. TerB]